MKTQTGMIDLANKFYKKIREENVYSRSPVHILIENPEFPEIYSREGLVINAGRTVTGCIAEDLLQYNLELQNATAFGVAGWGLYLDERTRTCRAITDTVGQTFDLIRGLGDMMKRAQIKILRKNTGLISRLFNSDYSFKIRSLKRMENEPRNSCSYWAGPYVGAEGYKDELDLSRSRGGYQDQMEEFVVQRVRDLVERR